MIPIIPKVTSNKINRYRTIGVETKAEILENTRFREIFFSSEEYKQNRKKQQAYRIKQIRIEGKVNLEVGGIEPPSEYAGQERLQV